MLNALLRPVRVFVENARFALGAIFGNRLRTFLTVLGIVVGVATVIVMVAFVQGFEAAIVGNMTSFGATLVQYQKFEPRFGGGREPPEEERRRRDLTVADAEALKRLCPSLRAVSPERYLFSFDRVVSVKAEGRSANGPLIVGVYPDYMEANNHFADDGRFVSDADIARATQVAVVGRDLVEALYPGVDPLDRFIEVDGSRFRIIGLLERKGSAFGGSNDNFVLLPFSTFDRHFPWVKNGGGDTIHIATIPKRAEWVERAIDEGTAVLRARRGLRPGEPNDFTVWTPDKLLAQTRSIRNAIGLVVIFIASTALLVGGVGVMNVMLVAVTERTREIGTRMALGARRRDIILQFLTESATLTGIGGLAGVGIASAIVALIRLTGVPAAAAPWAIALGVGASVIIGVFFGLYPAWKAANLDPIEALRYE